MLTQRGKAIKIAVIGYGDSGKSYFLASLCSLKDIPVKHGFAVYEKDFVKNPVVTKDYNIINRTADSTTDGVVFKTIRHRDIDFYFQQGGQKIAEIRITDAEGQALEIDRKVEEGEALFNRMHQYDGVILVVKAPDPDEDSKNRVEFQKKNSELQRLLLFINDLKNTNINTPVALVFTQIDRLGKLQGVKDAIEDQCEEEQEMDRKKYPHLSEDDRESKNKDIRKDVINSLILPIMMKETAIDKLIETFKSQISIPKTGRKKVDNLKLTNVFVTTALGFDNSMPNPLDTNGKVDERTQVSVDGVKPYGVQAAFLWMIYKIIELKREDAGLFSAHYKLFDLNDLQDSIAELYKIGSTFSGENFDDVKHHEFWNYNVL